MLYGMLAGAAMALALGAPAAPATDDLYPPEQPSEPSLNATAFAECIDDAPWITYDVTLVDADDASTSRDASLVFTKGANRFEVPLGTLGADNHLEGRILWPAAEVDASGTGSDWPGWVQDAAGRWSEVGEADLGWTRQGTAITVEVNPEAVTAMTYPPSTPGCVLHPRSQTGAQPAAAQPGPTGLAATGADIAVPLLVGAALVAGGVAFATARRRPRM
ncbi:cell wall protein [Microbacterium stercoris]|uniref:Cell wall protein n=1 Tax=Microbacterium stercoris TaxID=2820289 RepID=A0A939QI18_9MICO|nr:cell wall protein [Microbacterium stercoris]MBO3663228.1 cell wall protein [Microbacterium stercoris]